MMNLLHQVWRRSSGATERPVKIYGSILPRVVVDMYRRFISLSSTTRDCKTEVV
jgi:hypothetical protein